MNFPMEHDIFAGLAWVYHQVALRHLDFFSRKKSNFPWSMIYLRVLLGSTIR
jgi:hypothetical protein